MKRHASLLNQNVIAMGTKSLGHHMLLVCLVILDCVEICIFSERINFWSKRKRKL